jgi:hypothetical protein
MKERNNCLEHRHRDPGLANISGTRHGHQEVEWLLLLLGQT